MQTILPYITRFIAAAIGLLWCYIEPSLNYIGVCFFALLLDCYTAWRLNRRIYTGIVRLSRRILNARWTAS